MSDVFASVEADLKQGRLNRIGLAKALPGIEIEHEEDERPGDDPVEVDLSVAVQGNSPLKHYARASLDASLHVGHQTAIKAGHGFLYALVFPKANGMTIGIGVSSSYDLNRQHQPLDVIHYSEVMAVAARIAEGSYTLTDGPLTQRFFGDEAAYKARYARGEYSGDTMREQTTIPLRNAGALVNVMQKMHREVWGDPLDEATTITLDPDRIDYDLVVRFDDYLNRVVIGVTPKFSVWGPTAANGTRRLNPMRLSKAEGWEFRELLRFNKRTLRDAILRWDEAGVVRLPLRTAFGDFQLSGEALQRTLSALRVEGELQGWDVRL